jgi:hypothetical protein
MKDMSVAPANFGEVRNDGPGDGIPLFEERAMIVERGQVLSV